jgi:hypothetical protein
MKVVISIVALVGIINFAAVAQQGVKGQLFLVTGNQMPGPDRKPVPGKGVIREIHIYKLTNMTEVEQEDGFYKKVHTQFVKSQISKADGTFKIKLPPGRYSLFVKENKGLHANIFDNENNISPFTVERKTYTRMTVKINYAATY